MRTTCIVSVVVLSALAGGGCAQSPAWGKRATPLPGWKRIERAALSSVSDTQTWAPLLGAAALQIGDLDEEVADWARREEPLFGGIGGGDKTSDYFRDLNKVAWATTLVATPSGRSLSAGLWGKAKGAAVEGVALYLQGKAVGSLKDWTERWRPDGSGRDSFPSAHTSDAAAYGALARRHLEAMHLGPADRSILGGAFTAATALTAWSRVEAGRHYPSDVLVGWSIGNFVSLFMHDAFIGRTRGGPSVILAPDGKGMALNVTINQ